MANRKISDLTALTAPVTGDLLPIVDISEAAAADKNKKITYGNLFTRIPAGIGFPATQVASADPNTLDDYEEGTWTPTATNMTTTGSPAYGGRYRKIGSQVTIWFFTTTAGGVATYTATANSTFVSGLPFNSGYDGVSAAGGPPGVAVNGNTTAGGFLQGPVNGSATFYFGTTISSTQGLSASLTYYV